MGVHAKIRVEYKGKLYTYRELSELPEAKVDAHTITNRIHLAGWAVEKAVITPITRKVCRKKIIKKDYPPVTEEEKEYWNNLVLDNEYKKKFMNRPIKGDIPKI